MWASIESTIKNLSVVFSALACLAAGIMVTKDIGQLAELTVVSGETDR